MKRPLFIFTVYLFVFMSMAAIAGHSANDSDIDATTVAQAQTTSRGLNQ